MFETDRSLSERRERAFELLKLVGLEDRLDHFPSKLSGGERQRVAIARSLANGPSLLLADEPTGNLDSENAHLVLDLIIRLQQEQGRTMVLVTHDPTIAERAGRILRMKDGQIVSDDLLPQGHDLLHRRPPRSLASPVRTGLTLAGISIGIAAVVALVGMSRGFEKGWQVGLKARGTDIVISNKTADRSRQNHSMPPSAIGLRSLPRYRRDL